MFIEACDFDEPEVRDLYDSVIADEQVRRLHIAMDHAMTVSDLEATGGLKDVADSNFRVEPTRFFDQI